MELINKTCMVTGANSGLGLATARQLAAAGARVILVCRDSGKGKETARYIRQTAPQAALGCLLAGSYHPRAPVGDQRSLRKLAFIRLQIGVF
jgi:NAD(P)-dependent dehydrogenase (short-subunit alcohol dehydrogenase family)